MAGWSWGTQAAADVGALRFGRLRHPVAVTASGPGVIPGGRLREREMLVGLDQIKHAVREACG